MTSVCVMRSWCSSLLGRGRRGLRRSGSEFEVLHVHVFVMEGDLKCKGDRT